MAPSWFCELARAGARVCCPGGPGSACCAAGAALPCVLLCSGLISSQRSCTSGCCSSGAARCCQWPWEMTSMTWGKSSREGCQGCQGGPAALSWGCWQGCVCFRQPGDSSVLLPPWGCSCSSWQCAHLCSEPSRARAWATSFSRGFHEPQKVAMSPSSGPALLRAGHGCVTEP